MKETLWKMQKENPKLLRNSVRGRLSVKEQIIRLRDSEGRIVETEEETCDELNAKFQGMFTVEEAVLPALGRWEGGGEHRKCYDC